MIIDEAHHATAKGWDRAIRRFPGKAVGMTATPWRLSQKEGFDHLFRKLVRGADVPDLQEPGFLCNAKVLIPSPEYRIQGGEIGSIGDYTESGIERANQEHIMTAGILEESCPRPSDDNLCGVCKTCPESYRALRVRRHSDSGYARRYLATNARRHDS